MPQNDPGLWRMIVDALEHIRMSLWQESIRPHVMATVLSFLIALLRALVGGGKFLHSLLEACLCGTLTLAVFPLLNYYGLNIYLAVSIGAAISFLGVDWLRTYTSEAAVKILNNWISKKD